MRYYRAVLMALILGLPFMSSRGMAAEFDCSSCGCNLTHPVICSDIACSPYTTMEYNTNRVECSVSSEDCDACERNKILTSPTGSCCAG